MSTPRFPVYAIALLMAHTAVYADTDPAVADRLREIAEVQEAALTKITSYKVDVEMENRQELRVPDGSSVKEIQQIPAHMLGEHRTVSKGTQWWKDGQIRRRMRRTQDMPSQRDYSKDLENMLVEEIKQKSYDARYYPEPPMANTVIVNMRRTGPQAFRPNEYYALPSEPATLESSLTTFNYERNSWSVEDDTLDHVALLKLTNTQCNDAGEIVSIGTIWLDPARDHFTVRTQYTSTDGEDEERKNYTYQPLPGGGWFPETVEEYHKEKGLERQSSVTYRNPEVNLPLEDSFFTYETFSYRGQEDLTMVVTHSDRQEYWAWTNGQWALTKTYPLAPAAAGGPGLPGVPVPQNKRSLIRSGSREDSKHNK